MFISQNLHVCFFQDKCVLLYGTRDTDSQLNHMYFSHFRVIQYFLCIFTYFFRVFLDSWNPSGRPSQADDAATVATAHELRGRFIRNDPAQLEPRPRVDSPPHPAHQPQCRTSLTRDVTPTSAASVTSLASSHSERLRGACKKRGEWV